MHNIKKKKKRIIYYLIFIFLLFLLLFGIILYPTIKNNKYNKQILNNIYQKTDIKDITYFNKSNNYYIIKDSKEIKVLDLNYDNIYSRNIENLYSSNLDIVYRRGNIYYEEKIKEDKKLIYKYYDIESGEFIFDIEVGGV